MPAKIQSEESIKLLLLLDILKHTSPQNTMNRPMLQVAVESRWKELFPDKPAISISESTIYRHIADIKAVGLYDIRTCKNQQGGYYSNETLFDAGEFSIIAQALFRSTSLTANDTRRLLEKFLHYTDDLGESYLDALSYQVQRKKLRRKTIRDTLPILKNVVKGISLRKKIVFSYYQYRFDGEIGKAMPQYFTTEKDGVTGETKKYTVSPYFLVWESDACYLIGYVEENEQKNARPKRIKEKGKKHLTHFKVSMISSNVLVLGERDNKEHRTPISQMGEFPRYSMGGTVPERIAKEQREKEPYPGAISDERAMKDFSLDRYLRENLYMFHDDSEVIDVKLYFNEEFIGELLERFNLNQKMLDAHRTTRYDENGRQIYSAVVTVQPNEGFYRWLMGQGANVTVAEPASIRQEVKRRLSDTLRLISQYEESDEKDPIDYEALKKKQRQDAIKEKREHEAIKKEIERNRKKDKGSIVSNAIDEEGSDNDV